MLIFRITCGSYLNVACPKNFTLFIGQLLDSTPRNHHLSSQEKEVISVFKMVTQELCWTLLPDSNAVISQVVKIIIIEWFTQQLTSYSPKLQVLMIIKIISLIYFHGWDSLWQQAQKASTNYSFFSNGFQLIRGNSHTCPKPQRYMISPSSRTCLIKLSQEPNRGQDCMVPKQPQHAPLNLKD